MPSIVQIQLKAHNLCQTTYTSFMSVCIHFKVTYYFFGLQCFAPPCVALGLFHTVSVSDNIYVNL